MYIKVDRRETQEKFEKMHMEVYEEKFGKKFMSTKKSTNNDKNKALNIKKIQIYIDQEQQRTSVVKNFSTLLIVFSVKY